MQLSQKRKILSDFVFVFCKFRFKFGLFEKKDDIHS